MLGPLVVAPAGVLWGIFLEAATGHFLGQCAFLAGGLFALAGLFLGLARGQQARGGLFPAKCLIFYVVMSAAVEPLLFVSKASTLFVALAWLFPVIVGGVLLPRRGYWLVGLGCWLVLFSGTIALGFNFSQAGWGMGFLMKWYA
jgi:hypothetical protein